jgi:hypothetical protein
MWRNTFRNGENHKISFNGRLRQGLLLVLAAVLLAGCGGGHESDAHAPVFDAQILSDPAADGDIAFSAPSTHTVSSALATGNIQVGIDPGTGDEFRGFLDFPIRGDGGVPEGAAIDSATLEIFVNNMTLPFPGQGIPVLIDLVSFQPPTLIASDFDRLAQPALLTMAFDFLPSDTGTFVAIDVTVLMEQAQFENLPDLQLRILPDFLAGSGLVEIDDGDAATAPLLTVSYF